MNSKKNIIVYPKYSNCDIIIVDNGNILTIIQGNTYYCFPISELWNWKIEDKDIQP